MRKRIRDNDSFEHRASMQDPTTVHEPSLRVNRDAELTLSNRVLRVAIYCLAILQFGLIFGVSANWDEYNELAILFAPETGFSQAAFRHGFQYLIWPLKLLALSDYALLTLARIATFTICTLGIYRQVYVMAERVAPPGIDRQTFAMLSVLLLQTMPTFFESSIQFRTDQLITLLFLFCVNRALLQPGASLRVGEDLTLGALLGVALFVNPKAFYHCAALLAVVWVQARQSSRNLASIGWQLARIGTAAVGVFFSLVGIHMQCQGLSFAALPEQAKQAAEVGFGRTHSWTYKSEFVSTLFVRSPAQLFSLLFGFWVILRKPQSIATRSPKLMQLCAAALVLLFSLVLHQGTYRYFVIDIFAPSAIIGSLGLCSLFVAMREFSTCESSRDRKWANSKVVLTGGLMILLCTGIGLRLPMLAQDTRVTQRQFEQVIKSLLPVFATTSTLQYIDGFSALAGSNNVLGLWSNKRFLRHRQQNDAQLQHALEQAPAAFINFSDRLRFRKLKPQDQAAIRRNFIPIVGGLWVHGTRPHRRSRNSPATFNARIAGTYSLSGVLTGCTINGTPANSSMELTVGSHHVVCGKQSYVAEIVFGPSLANRASWIFKIPAQATVNIRSGEELVYFDSKYGSLTQLTCVPISGSTMPGGDFDRSEPQAPRKVLENQGISLPPGNFSCSNAGTGSLTLSPLGPFFLNSRALQN